jgi:UDP-N-acetyl-D-glucosamine/UDP-N-acetyl-D-galactosamine dehydrogenase
MKHLNSKSKISIIGMGYVGLPLAEKLSQHYNVIGFDIDKKRIGYLKKNIDLNSQISFSQLSGKKIFFTYNEENLKDTNLFIITVPTPIFKNKKPDLKPLQMASKTVAKYLRKNSIVVYESTVYPGCTKNFCIPILSKFSRLKYNKDFFCGYSPERINVGDKINTIENIVKIVSGSSPEVSKVIKKVYQKISVKNNIFLAKSIEIAEAAKIIENIQRDLNIALVNELTIIFNKMGLNINDVLDAASTKWNFIRYKPGLVGGHCIGVDPYYLTHACTKLNYKPKLILSGRRLNESISKFLKDEMLKKLHKNFEIKKFKILVLGLTFKENCNDIRNSKVIDLVKYFENKHHVDVYDPYISKYDFKKAKVIKKNSIYKKKYHGVIHAVDHESLESICRDVKKYSYNFTSFFSIKNFKFKNL